MSWPATPRHWSKLALLVAVAGDSAFGHLLSGYAGAGLRQCGVLVCAGATLRWLTPLRVGSPVRAYGTGVRLHPGVERRVAGPIVLFVGLGLALRGLIDSVVSIWG